MVRWPSGPRRQTKDQGGCHSTHLVRKGVGSNPTLITFCCLRRFFSRPKSYFLPLFQITPTAKYLQQPTNSSLTISNVTDQSFKLSNTMR